MSQRALVDAACALAFHRAGVAEANEAIAWAREHMEAGGVRGTSYEVVLPALDPDDFLARRTLPKLVNFLCCRGVRLPASGGVFVSLFTGEGLFFVEAGPLAELLGRSRGLDAAELMRRYGPDGPGDPLLLGR
ncbi:MAG: STAUR_1299 family protein [Myxococcota bacterium]